MRTRSSCIDANFHFSPLLGSRVIYFERTVLSWLPHFAFFFKTWNTLKPFINWAKMSPLRGLFCSFIKVCTFPWSITNVISGNCEKHIVLLCPVKIMFPKQFPCCWCCDCWTLKLESSFPNCNICCCFSLCWGNSLQRTKQNKN